MCWMAVMFVVGVAMAQTDPDFDTDRSVNPIMRYWAQQRFRGKLPVLQAMAAKNGEEESRYRNCYLSPIQCQLPVRLEKPALAPSMPYEESVVRLRRVILPHSQSN